ncbi:MAG: hypothetical protein ACR2NA_04340 [Solirubrobacterales bacterium]
MTGGRPPFGAGRRGRTARRGHDERDPAHTAPPVPVPEPGADPARRVPSANDELYRRVIGFAAAWVTVGGLVIVVRSLVIGGNLLSTGFLVGLLFVLVGMVRLVLAIRWRG